MARIKFKLSFPLLFIIVFFVIPFFWFKPGEMDLGGDASRLYFYDPINYISQSLYSISYGAFGIENASYFASIPFFLLLILGKFILRSPTVLIEVFHGFSLSVAFLACYLIIKDLLNQEADKSKFGKNIVEVSAILAGVFYNLSPVPILNWDHILLTGNVFFLNPLMFLLLLRFFLTGNIRYMLGSILISFIFAPNFSFAGAPPFFSFYPISILFIILYTKFVANKPIPIKKILFSVLLFFLIHIFQLGPQIVGLLTPGNLINTAVFSQQSIVDRGLSYFATVAPSIKTSRNLLALQQQTSLNWYAFFFIIFPILLVLGFIWNKKKGYLFSGVFFLIVLFFASANITKVGFTVYISLFQIPGFSMFRNFYGQWFRSFDFFYMLLLGQAVAIVLSKLHKKFHKNILITFILMLLFTTSWPMIDGELVNTNLWQSKNIKSHIEMDPQYEKALDYIRALPIDGRVLTLPMSNYSYQILQGKNGGAYMGPSTITYLTQKSEFIAPGDFGSFGSVFLKAVRDKDYLAVKNILSVFNVKYIFYNSDPYIYGDNFPAFPYEQVLKYLPQTQEEYKAFIENLGVKKIVDFGEKYHVYTIKDTEYLPHIYVVKESYYVDQLAKEALIPLFFDLPEKRIALFNEYIRSQNIGRYDKIFLKAKNKSLYADAAKKKDYQPIDYPGIAERLSPLLSSITGLTQQYKLNQIDDAYIDFATKKAESIIEKLKTKGEQLSIFVDPLILTNWDKEPNDLKQIFSTNVLIDGSWNLELYNYTTSMADVINKIKKPNKSLYTVETNKNSLGGSLGADEIGINRVIVSLRTKSDQDKILLMLLTNKIFDFLRSQLDINLPKVLETNYVVNIPEDGVYNIYRYRDILDSQKQSSESVSIDNKKLGVHKAQPEQNWLRFDDVSIQSKTDVSILRPFVDNTLTKDEIWQTIDGHIVSRNGATFLLNNFLGDGQGLYRRIVPFIPNMLYTIAFDYKTLGKNFWINVVELAGKVNKAGNLDKGDSLRSYDWKTYRTVVQTGEDPDAIFLIQIIRRDNCLSDCPILENLDKVEIKNLSVIAIPQPDVVLIKKNASHSQEKKLPQITFTKLNPTKYKINIRNATNPYSLVFQQAFNKEWKLYQINQNVKEDENSNRASYFNADIIEGNHTNTFLNSHTFDTWGKQTIADKKHFLVNGYANAWNITPEDTDGKKDYTLILEFNTQRIAYVFFLVSFITLIACIGMIISPPFERKKE